MQIYRRIQWGRLAAFHMLDTRQYRSDQACNDTTSDCPAALDPARSITGPDQEKWLLDGLGRSSATWDVIGQQVFFAARDFTAGPAVSYSMDAWDGYVASRQRILDGIQQRNVTNPVVLTGDVHKHYANDLKADFRNPDSATVGVELVTTSITSGGDGQDTPTAGELQLLTENPHIKLVSNQRGYVSTRIERDSLRADFKVLPSRHHPGCPGLHPGLLRGRGWFARASTRSDPLCQHANRHPAAWPDGGSLFPRSSLTAKIPPCPGPADAIVVRLCHGK